MADVFWCNATFEKWIAYFVATCNIWKTNTKVMLAPCFKVQLLTYGSCNFNINTPFFKIFDKGWMNERKHLKMLKGILRCDWLGCGQTD